MADPKMEAVEATAAAIINVVLPLIQEYDGRTGLLALEKAVQRLKVHCSSVGSGPV